MDILKDRYKNKHRVVQKQNYDLSNYIKNKRRKEKEANVFYYEHTKKAIKLAEEKSMRNKLTR